MAFLAAARAPSVRVCLSATDRTRHKKVLPDRELARWEFLRGSRYAIGRCPSLHWKDEWRGREQACLFIYSSALETLAKIRRLVSLLAFRRSPLLHRMDSR